MANKNYYAHLSNNRRERLIDHLTETGVLAEKFASVFGCGKLGLQLGLLLQLPTPLGLAERESSAIQ